MTKQGWRGKYRHMRRSKRKADLALGQLARERDAVRHQRELLRESLQQLLVHVGMIAPWAGLGDLDAFNDGPLLCLAVADFIESCPDAKERLQKQYREVRFIDRNSHGRGCGYQRGYTCDCTLADMPLFALVT